MYKNEFKRAPPLIVETTGSISLSDQFRRQSDPNYIPRKELKNIKLKKPKSAFKKGRAKQGRVVFPNKKVKEPRVSSLGGGYISSVKEKKESEKFIEPRDQERDRRADNDNLKRDDLKTELKQSSLILQNKIDRRLAQQEARVNAQILSLSQAGSNRSVVDDFKSFVDVVDRISGVRSAPTNLGSSRGSNLGMPQQPVIVSSFADTPDKYIQFYYNSDKGEFLREYPENLAQLRDLSNLGKVNKSVLNSLTAEAQQYAKANQKPPVDVQSLATSRAYVDKKDIDPNQSAELFKLFQDLKQTVPPAPPSVPEKPTEEDEKKIRRDLDRIQKGKGTKTFYSRSSDSSDKSKPSGDTDLEVADASRVAESITGGRKGLEKHFTAIRKALEDPRGGLADPPINKGDLADKVERAVLNENAQGQSKVSYSESKSSRHSNTTSKSKYSSDSRRREIFQKDGGQLQFTSFNGFNTGDNIFYKYDDSGKKQEGVGRLTGFYQLAEERLGQVRAEITFKDGQKTYLPMNKINKKSMKKISDKELVKQQTRGDEDADKKSLRERLTPDTDTSSKKSLVASFKSDSITDDKLTKETEKIIDALGGNLTETQKDTIKTLGDMATNDPEIREKFKRQKEIKKTLENPDDLFGSESSSSTDESEKSIIERKEVGAGGSILSDPSSQGDVISPTPSQFGSSPRSSDSGIKYADRPYSADGDTGNPVSDLGTISERSEPSDVSSRVQRGFQVSSDDGAGVGTD